MSFRTGACGICNAKGTELEEHHVVEYLDDKRGTPKVFICSKCHLQQERYKNYLRDDCGIDIDRRNQR